ncbi:MAG: P-type conjugative transfer protein TrbL, partial [Rhodospirillales bacterium]|nr:P-type conjugative transfer protein TrbL [Acetobacter sp.]
MPALHAQNADVGSEITNQFSNAITGFGTQIEQYAERLFWSLAACSLVWTGVTLVLRKSDVLDFMGELIRFTITTGFFYWLLKNGTDIAVSIVTSLQQAGSTVGGGDGTSRGNTVLQLALNFADAAANNVSYWDPKMAVMWTLIALIALLIGCYMIVCLIVALCSALMLIYAGVFVLGFGGSKWTSEMAISYYKAVIAAGLRLFTLNLLMNTAINLVSQYTASDMTALAPALTCLAALVIVALLVDKVPAQIAGLVTHNHIGAPGSAVGTLTGAASLAAQGVAGVASGGVSLAASGGAAVKNAAMRAVAAMRK